jgi:type VI secretion system secreted protein VgrG
MADGSRDGDPAVISYRFESAAFPGVRPRVLRVRLVEALNEPFAAEIVVDHPNPDADVTQMLGKDATLVVERRPHERRVCGIVRQVDEGRVDGDVARVRMLVVPALWMLGRRRNTRMFQRRTARQILETVLNEGLGPYGRSVTLELSASYPTREYCLQYQESDLDFVHRLMEEEGIGYAFEHEGETEVLVLRDRNQAFPRAGAPVPFSPTNQTTQGGPESIKRFLLEAHTTTTSVTTRDWDWTRGGNMVVENHQAGEDELGRDRESYEHGLGRSLSITEYSQGVRRYQAEDSGRQKQVRGESLTMRGRVGRGIGRVIGFSAGTRFELTGHPAVGADGEYLVTRIVHENRQAAFASEGADEEYHNAFECIPAGTPYRPARRTPKPRIASVQTAVVTGPAGEEIHVDEHGRVKVQFHWDRENPADDTSSVWLRCRQSWSGGGWGFWWVPRIGMEVVVQFIDGDPDRPLVTGTVYNGTNALPYELPAEKTKSTIKSNSSPGGGGFNEFRYEDRAGSEEIFTHAQKDYNEVVEHDHNTLVHNNQTNTVDVDQTQTVTGNQTETVHANQTMTVDGNRTVHVKSNFDETVDATETRTVAGDVTETFDANETRSVAASLTEQVLGDVTRMIAANQAQTIAAARSQNVGGSVTELIGGSLSQIAGGAISSTTPGTHTMVAGGPFNFTSPAAVTMTAPAGIRVSAPGGYKQVDNFWKWVGGLYESKTAHSISIWGGKTSITGVSISVAGVRAGFTKISVSQGGVEIWANGSQQEVGAVENQASVQVDVHVPKFEG